MLERSRVLVADDDELLYLIPAPDQDRPPEGETDPAAFFRALGACVLLSMPLWVVLAVLLRTVLR